MPARHSQYHVGREGPDYSKGLDDENIRYQLVTFLIAGHDTTSGLLSFAIYELLQHPDVLGRAREEADRVLGSEPPQFEQLQNLVYIDQVLKETLRLWPPVPAFALYPYEQETVIGGKYTVRSDQSLMVLTSMLHRDPAVWGTDPETFNPDHFSFENAQKLPPTPGSRSETDNARASGGHSPSKRRLSSCRRCCGDSTRHQPILDTGWRSRRRRR